MKQETKVAIYTRVSTADQSTEGQKHELEEYARRRGWHIQKTYSDTISGSKSSRPALDEMLKDAKQRKFDCVLVWRIDRMGRSVSHLLEVLELFRTFGVEFISLNESIDTSTPPGKMVFVVLAAVAELERSITVERVKMGLQNARRRGVQLGRPAIKRLRDDEVQKVRTARNRGATLRELARKFGTSVWSVSRACQG
jgi:DNA invertase Pin-like site-specific DNA recombinase